MPQLCRGVRRPACRVRNFNMTSPLDLSRHQLILQYWMDGPRNAAASTGVSEPAGSQALAAQCEWATTGAQTLVCAPCLHILLPLGALPAMCSPYQLPAQRPIGEIDCLHMQGATPLACASSPAGPSRVPPWWWSLP